MAKNRVVAGLDVGTSSIKLVVVQKGETGWDVLASSQAPSFGLRRGAVVDDLGAQRISKIIQLLTADVEREYGIKTKSVFVSIGGSHLYSTPSDGLISVSRADRIISEEDIDRVFQATKAVNISRNEEILDVFPREFIIDDQKGIKQPLGLTGVRLEAKVVLLCYFQSYFINLTQAVLGARLQIDDVIPSPLAAARAVLTPQQKEIGAAVIDIGAATTSLAVFEEGDLIHLAVFPLGSANITNDIAIGLRTDVATAEDIKKKYGSCISVKSDVIGDGKIRQLADGEAKKKIEISEKSLSFTKKEISDIVEPRVYEILDLMQKELKKIGRQEFLPGGAVLTGGGAKMPKIKELAKQILKLPCEIGVPKGINGIGEDPSLATVAGLILSGTEEDSSGTSEALSGSFWKSIKKFTSKFGRAFRVFIP